MSPFSQAAVKSMRKLYPEALADKSFDNTGLLLESPLRQNQKQNTSVLLTIDLTKEVADEAISRKDSIIISYHPIIFRPLKSLGLGNSQQSSLLRLAQEGISVYCPHTAVDAAPGGVNDWLADIVVGRPTKANSSSGETPHQRSVITSVDGIQGFEGAGMGRIVKLHSPVTMQTLVNRIGQGIHSSDRDKYLNVALPAGGSLKDEVSSIGLCAGSGGSILGGLEVDVLFTGELSHHEALAATQNGQYVVTAFHSRTERNFLSQVLKDQLSEELAKEWGITKKSADGGEDGQSGRVNVAVSNSDHDPWGVFPYA